MSKSSRLHVIQRLFFSLSRIRRTGRAVQGRGRPGSRDSRWIRPRGDDVYVKGPDGRSSEVGGGFEGFEDVVEAGLAVI